MKKFELVLYNFIKENCRLPKEAKEKKSLTSYYLKKLIDKGLIERASYAVWKVIKEVQTSSNNLILSKATTMETSPKNCRSHAYRFNVKLPYIYNWDKRAQFMDKHNIKYKQVSNGQIIKVRKHNVIVSKESINIVFKKGKYFIGNEPEINNGQAIIELNKTLTALERLLMANIKFGSSYQLQCHHANINNTLAKYYRERGINKWSIQDSKGEEWLLVDNSFNLLELETINKTTSTKDYKIVVEPLMNTLRDNPNILGKICIEQQELIKENEKLKEALLILTQSQRDQAVLINELIKLQRSK